MNKRELSLLFDELFPINRSILGKGYKQSLRILKRYVNFKEIKYKSDKNIFDWKIPKEWIIKDAFVKFKGKKIIDFKKNNLHVINYSTKIDRKIELKKLKKNLHTSKIAPGHIPYVTSYYKKRWGFCLSKKQMKNLKPGEYDCYINTFFKKGYLINGLCELKGKSKKINLISSYLCHPSLANNELSGPLVMIGLYEKMKKWKKMNYTYQFLINPETIGSLCYLHSHFKKIKQNFNSGLVLTCLGGPKKKLTYKLSKSASSTLDRLFIRLSKKKKVLIRDFDAESGSDERQYNSPGFNLPVGNISKTVYGGYRYYHTSGDSKNFMKIDNIYKSINDLEKILKIHDELLPIKRVMPYGEPMLSKRKLYSSIGTLDKNKLSQINLFKDKSFFKILMNILSYADGKKNILDICEIQSLDFKKSLKVLNICIKKKLIKYE